MTKAKPKTKARTAPKTDLYERVTNTIIEALEAGVRPWAQPWKNNPDAACISRPLRFSGEPYTGINVVLLWIAGVERGFESPVWMTYKQAQKIGAQVRGGEKGTTIIYASRFKKEVDNPKKPGETTSVSIPFLRDYTVFNVAQIDNLPAEFQPQAADTAEVSEASRLQRIAHAEEFFADIGATVRHGGNSAYFSQAGDFIQLPPVEQFKTIESYYSTSGHEHIHWSGHKDRLDREFGKRFGDQAYAAEELVAELGSAFLCADLGIPLDVREDHAAYLDHWLTVLKGDKKFIVTAASQAQKAVEFLKATAAGELAAPEVANENAEIDPAEVEVAERAA